MNSISIVALSACISILATLYTIYRQSKKDAKSEGESSTSVKEEMKYISRGIEDIKYDTRSLTSTISSLNDRLIRTEEGLKNVNDKLDEHIKKGGK